MLHVEQSRSFAKIAKKLPKSQKKELDEAVRCILNDPEIGERKKGDLDFVRVYKFRMNRQLTLLAYSCNNKILTLLALGGHENFYRDLKG